MKKLVCLIFFICAGVTNATVIDFNLLTGSSGNTSLVNNVIDNGFTFTSPHAHIVNSPSTCSGTCADNGSIYLGGDMTSLTMSGSTFELNSFEMAEAFASLSMPTILTLTGTYTDSSMISTQFSFDDIFDGTGPLADFEKISVGSAWSNLSEVTFSANGWFSIDNIVVNKAPASVPEPASIALLWLGLAGLAASRRQKSAQ